LIADIAAIWTEYAIPERFAFTVLPVILHVVVPMNGTALAIYFLNTDETQDFVQIDNDITQKEITLER
jgi:uncharacterized protein YxeA